MPDMDSGDGVLKDGIFSVSRGVSPCEGIIGNCGMPLNGEAPANK